MSRLPAAGRFPATDYLNRELGILAFNRRVLAQARDERVPVLERLRFLCIVSSNLDEFFEIRVAGLKEQIRGNSPAVTTDGATAQDAFRKVSREAHAIVAEQYDELNAVLFPRLEQQGIITSSRDGNLRVSPHFYNSGEDVKRLFAALDIQRDLLV